jgi:PqqD family protein of HPr-rel-A system
VASGEVGGRHWSWDGGALHVVDWGDELVAFHEATASTHLLDQDSVKVVQTLRDAGRAMTGAELWSTAFGEPTTGSDFQALDEMLEKLLQAGLVTATDS